jgi:hypothetical protein
MKRLLCVLVVLVGGCNSDQVAVPLEREVKPPKTYVFSETDLGHGMQLKVLIYEGRRHVFLGGWQGGLAKVGEYPVDGEKR